MLQHMQENKKNEIFKKTNQPPTNVSHLRWPKVSFFY